VDYSKWPVQSVAINRLRLDPENPRLATSVKRPTQQELIADLIEHEAVIDLVRDIARQGFFPNELLVAIKDGANIIVVEGNRRLAALKLLLNPELAPAGVQNRIRQHAERMQPPVEKAPVVLAPSRAAAVPLIIARHKGEAVKAWTTIMQARFLQSRLDHGLGIDEIAEETGLERSEVVRQLRDAKLYDVIRSLSLSAAVQQVVNDPRQFPFTTLRRLIDYSSVQGVLGMQTDEKHGFVTTLAGDRFQQVLARITTDIAEGEVTSRSHNTAAEIDHYIKDLDSCRPVCRSVTRTTARRQTRKEARQETVAPCRVDPERLPY
jgi:hypothetical protein